MGEESVTDVHGLSKGGERKAESDSHQRMIMLPPPQA